MGNNDKWVKNDEWTKTANDQKRQMVKTTIGKTTIGKTTIGFNANW